MSNIFDLTIEDKIGVVFTNKTILKEAFTHSSYANEKKVKSNENLEFFGDSILSFIVSQYLYEKYPNVKEGELSVMRSNIVSAKPLSEAVIKLQLEEHLFLGAGESRSSGNKMNVYADLFEAIVAAVYLDQDMAAAKKFVLSSLKDVLTEKRKTAQSHDGKTALQEFVQKQQGKIRYEETAKTGPDHDPTFSYDVLVNDEIIASGSGKSKREAQQNAASKALLKLR